MEQKNENEFFMFKNYCHFLIDIGLNVSFSNESSNETYPSNVNKILKSIKDLDDYIKEWQKEANINLISRNDNVYSKNIILLSEENNLITINQSELFKKMFSSIGQNIDDFFIINVDLVNAKEDNIKKIDKILKLYFTILKPNILIDMSSADLDDVFEINSLNLNFNYFKIPSISKIIKNEILKRDAWTQLKLIKARLDEL